ncbi:hypothetical protein PIROE2DRAFT_17028 [Piromyces sp. E2]|nr:hypothetical protein PIROE2DRAFT_17028 [Piromyces sp. E2]|eukprot:OUM57861.1 hypothetical protein PIROE2DRAFT_17028 [Piromyces sp. E2]
MANLNREDEKNDILSYILGIFFLIAITIPTIIFSKNDINTLSTFGLPAENSFYVKIFNQFIEDNKQINKTTDTENDFTMMENGNNIILDYNINPVPILYQPLNLNIIIENHNIYNELYKGEEEDEDEDDDDDDDDDDGWFDDDEEEEEFDITILSLGVSVYFVGAFIYEVLPDLLKYITTNTDILLWPILIYCILVIISVYGIIVKYDNSEEKNKLVTTIYILFYLISYNYYNQLIKKFVNVHLSRTFSNFMECKYEAPWKSVKNSFTINFGSVFIGSFAIALLGIIKKIPGDDNQSVISLMANFIITLFSSPIHALLYYIVYSFSTLINLGMKPFEGIAISISGITGSSCNTSSKKASNIKDSNEKDCFDCSSFIEYILFVGQFGITWLTYIIINLWNNGSKNSSVEEMESILEITKKIDDLGLIVLICNKIFFGLIKSIIQASFDTSLVYYLDEKKVVDVPSYLAKYQIFDKYLDIENYCDLDLEKNIESWFEKIQGDEFQDFEEMFQEFLPLPGNK